MMEITEISKLLDLSGKTAIVTGAVGIGFGKNPNAQDGGSR